MKVLHPWFEKTKAVLMYDFWRKLLALFLAVLLYCTVEFQYIQSEPLRLSSVPLDIVLPPGMVQVGREVDSVSVVLTGSSRRLSQISVRDVQAAAKVPDGAVVRGKPYTLKLHPSDFKVPPGISVSQIEPREITLNVEPLVSRRLPIEVRFDSLEKLSKDYQIERISCVPDEVQVTGPESQVAELRLVGTQPIPLDRSVTDSFDFTAILLRPEHLTVTPARISVRIEVGRKYGSRSFAALPLQIISSPESRGLFSYELQDLPKLDVVVSGPESQLAGLRENNLRAFLDLSELRTPGTYSINPGCLVTGIPDSELKIKSVRPEKINVKVNKLQK